MRSACVFVTLACVHDCLPLLQVEMVLTENDYTLAMWPHKFKAVYTWVLVSMQKYQVHLVLNPGTSGLVMISDNAFTQHVQTGIHGVLATSAMPA